jgi:MFS family permease
MVNLAIILRIAKGTGSYARAGLVTGAYVIGTGLLMPFVGRLADRVGSRPVLLVAGVVNAAGLVSLAFVPVRDTAALLIVAAAAGASVPPVAPAVRSLWRHLVRPDLLSGLFAMDATLQEVTFMVGPSLVALVATFAEPAGALVACGLIGLVGAIAVAAHPAVGRDATKAPGPRQTADLAGLVTLVGVMVMFLAAIVIVEVSVVAFAGHHHASDQSGLLLSVWSLGSMAGGFVIGARMARSGAAVLAPLLAASALGFALLPLAPDLGALYGLIFVGGIAIAPGFSCIYWLVGELTPHGSSVEAFSWISSGIQVGAAIGAASGGLLVQSFGSRVAMLCAAGCALGTAGIALLRGHHLPGHPSSMPVSPGAANN